MYVIPPDWSRWLDAPSVALWQCVAISCDIEPECMNTRGRFNTTEAEIPLVPEFTRRLTLANDQVRVGGALHPFLLEATGDSRAFRLPLWRFGAWAVGRWNLPDRFPTVPPSESAVTLPEPQRRLAALRSLGGEVKRSNGKWAITGIGKLVDQEKANGFERSDEKTIRKDLKEAAEAAKREGPSTTRPASPFPT